MSKRGNVNNLIRRSPEEARELGYKGGKASGIARAKQARIRKALEAVLGRKIKTPFASAEVIAEEAIALAQVVKAAQGDTQAAVFVRDTIGEKPKEVIDTNIAVPVIVDDLAPQGVKRGKRKAK